MQRIEELIYKEYNTIYENEEAKKQSRVNQLVMYYSYFVLYSFIGWIWETVVTSIDQGALQNRGFLDIPLLPIYGFGVTFIIIFFYDKGISLIRTFLGSAFITAAMEFITSWVLEALFHRVWWDYSDMIFQIQGRVCLLATVTFGIISVLIVEILHPKIQKMVLNFIRYEKCKSLCVFSFTIILIDTIYKVIQLI